MYDLYSPDIQKIEVIKLERRLDNDLSYLKDALPKYSTFDPNMEPVQHVAGKEIELNPLKVRNSSCQPPSSGRLEAPGMDETLGAQ